MIKYIVPADGSSLIKLNLETQEVTIDKNIRTNIDWMWIAKEDGILDGKEVKAGDLIIKLYAIYDEEDRGTEVIIVRDENLFDYYARLLHSIRKHQEPKAYKASNDCSEPCDDCDEAV